MFDRNVKRQFRGEVEIENEKGVSRVGQDPRNRKEDLDLPGLLYYIIDHFNFNLQD